MRLFVFLVAVLCAAPRAGTAGTFLVLPFFNLTNTPNLNWIGESVAETVREAAASESVLALDREDREEAYRRLGLRPYARLTRASVLKLGQTLDADRVLYGWFELTPPEPVEGKTPATRGTLKLTARFLDLKNLSEGREFSEVGALEDLAALQSHLAWQAAELLAPGTTPPEREFRDRHPQVRVDALEYYIRGLLAASAPEKEKLFAQAARLDAKFSQPNFELGRIYWQDRDFRQAAEWLAKVFPTDLHAHEASFLLGLSRYELGDFAGAETALTQAARGVPLGEVFNDLGAAQSRLNRPEALGNFQKALRGDETDPVYQFNTGYALWKKGDFVAAAERFRVALKRDPEDHDAPLLLDLCVKRQGPQAGDTRTQGLERIKTNFEESAYRQLKAVFQPKGG